MKFPLEDLPAVGEAAHRVMREAMAAGVWIVGGGFEGFLPRVVGVDGSVEDGSGLSMCTGNAQNYG